MSPTCATFSSKRPQAKTIPIYMRKKKDETVTGEINQTMRDESGRSINITKLRSENDEIQARLFSMNKKTFTVLIAEDDLDDQESISAAFRAVNEEFEIISLSNGIQLLDCLLKRQTYKDTTYQPGLIMLDLNMPIMDGFDVLKEIRKHDDLKAIPVYVVTSSRDIDHLNKALDLGARGFYSKGASAKDIQGIVSEVCGKCNVVDPMPKS
jgi:two-component system, response regulator